MFAEDISEDFSEDRRYSENPRIRLGCPSRSTFHRLLESYFLWILAEKSTVMGPPGGGLTALQEPTLTVLLVLPRYHFYWFLEYFWISLVVPSTG